MLGKRLTLTVSLNSYRSYLKDITVTYRNLIKPIFFINKSVNYKVFFNPGIKQ